VGTLHVGQGLLAFPAALLLRSHVCHGLRKHRRLYRRSIRSRLDLNTCPVSLVPLYYGELDTEVVTWVKLSLQFGWLIPFGFRNREQLFVSGIGSVRRPTHYESLQSVAVRVVDADDAATGYPARPT